jgi:hypothetical protein
MRSHGSGLLPASMEKLGMDEGITVETEMFEHREVKPHCENGESC